MGELVSGSFDSFTLTICLATTAAPMATVAVATKMATRGNRCSVLIRSDLIFRISVLITSPHFGRANSFAPAILD
jgi:hypothetical protein